MRWASASCSDASRVRTVAFACSTATRSGSDRPPTVNDGVSLETQRLLDGADPLDERRRRRERLVGQCVGQLQIGVRGQIEQPLEAQVGQRTIDALANQHRLLGVAIDARAQDLEFRLSAGAEPRLYLPQRRAGLFQCGGRNVDQLIAENGVVVGLRDLEQQLRPRRGQPQLRRLVSDAASATCAPLRPPEYRFCENDNEARQVFVRPNGRSSKSTGRHWIRRTAAADGAAVDRALDFADAGIERRLRIERKRRATGARSARW